MNNIGLSCHHSYLRPWTLVVTFSLLLLLWSNIAFATGPTPMTTFEASIENIPDNIQQRMAPTLNPGCPIQLKDLAYVTLSYWGFDDQTHTGVLIVDRSVATQVVEIFKELYLAKFPIARMEPIYLYDNDDDKSMLANNTSAFNCREKTGLPGTFSVHSYGRAIDINPLMNPYIKGNVLLPATAQSYVDRNMAKPGMIIKDDIAYRAFISHGWTWGGDWTSLKDYQHFEKE